MNPEVTLSGMFGATLAGLLTLAIFSFLFRDNPFYKFAEHLFVGLASGYYVALQFHTVFLPNLWTPLTQQGQYINIIPLLLAVILFTRFIPNLAWLSRWSIGLMVGAYAGLALIGALQGDLVAQVQANMLPIATASMLQNIGNLVLILGTLTCLVFFFFSTEHKGAIGATARIGVYFLMVSFGASYGFTVMGRIALLIGRLTFLFQEWPAAFGARWMP
ncbi:MAG: hypothetical protein IT349_06980 [Candidatus Eisenbacteria bacterium]|nr:hypothetical protein [Candidatus Eisenbacteria bacterium]MCC7141832.1 hypothetical protein [Candidatus Eisenbacteria bacterium]